ncbi:DNA repair protein REV1, partial [Nephila pilipes]
LDQSVLEALPEDLRKEIIESCNSKTIQSSENSGINNFSPHPATSFTTEQHQVSETTCTTLKKGDSNHSIVSNKFYTDSPKLDESVLNALPEDLRKEILESCKKMTIQRSENSGISNFTQRISTSSMIKQHKDSHHSTDSNKLYADSPELDESVLNALPEDLKMEVLASYHDLYKKDYPAITTTKQQTSSFPSTSNQNQSLSISSESKQIPSTSLIPSISRENQSLIKSDTGLNKISTGEATASNVSSTFLCRLQGILSSQPEDVKLEVLKKYAPSTCNESFTPNSESSFKM